MNIYHEYKILVDLATLNDFSQTEFDNLKLVVDNNYLKEFNMLINKYMALSNDKSISFLGNGYYSSVYKIGDFVFKIGKTRMNINCNYQFFRFLKPLEKIILYKDEKANLVIEVQPYFDKSKQNITVEMIDKYFYDLKKYGFVDLDPNNIKRKPLNFALLNDYRLANVEFLSDLDFLPNYFKENPLVLIDVDGVYKKDEFFDNSLNFLSKIDYEYDNIKLLRKSLKQKLN